MERQTDLSIVEDKQEVCFLGGDRVGELVSIASVNLTSFLYVSQIISD